MHKQYIKSSANPYYRIWIGMKDRCGRVKHHAYHNYGGRGITVCERWKKDFTKFMEDMGPRPTSNHTLDRINYDGNYEHSNCRWATWKEQANNTRRNTRLPNGQTITEFAREHDLADTTVFNRVKRGWAFEKLHLPVKLEKYLIQGMTVKEFARKYGLRPDLIRKRINAGWPEKSLGRAPKKGKREL